MRKNFGVKPWVYPQPVLMIGTYDENGKPDLMNTAWGGQYDVNQVMLCLSSHKTTDNIKVTGAFTVSFATASTVVPCGYVGIVSAKQEANKMEKAGFTTVKSDFVSAPWTALGRGLKARKEALENSELEISVVLRKSLIGIIRGIMLRSFL